MNRLLELLSELDQTNQRLQQLEVEYDDKQYKGEIYHKTLKHLRKKKAEWEDKIRMFGGAYKINIYQGILSQEGKTRIFEITLVDVSEEEARTVIEREGGGTVTEMMILPVEILSLKFP